MKYFRIKIPFVVFVFIVIITTIPLHSQNETRNWFFGNFAGLDFSASPPNIVSNGMHNSSGCGSSMSDANGNLLFYTNGSTVWDKNHAVMGNGTGLFGNIGSGQGTIILPQPGSSTIYYIFCSSTNWNWGLTYSMVDMTLAAGLGSVTVKNATINTNNSNNNWGGKVAATRHCNGQDIWVLTQNWNNVLNSNTSFNAYLLTAAGVNTVPVVSTFTNNLNNWNNWNGNMKISPNGKKVGCANYNGNINGQDNFQLYDFDNNTGILSNYISLWNGSSVINQWGWGCEFSPDGTKFYGTRYNINGGLFQWDLCAGSPTAIAASQVTIAVPPVQLFSMQMALDGKIYVSRNGQQALGVINNPNAAGLACNYVDLGQSVAPRTTWVGLPNFMNSYFIQPPPVPPFTYTASNNFGCQTAHFTPPVTPNTTVIGCSAIGYSLTNLHWDFGDPASGVNNTSTQNFPAHAFTNLGTYTVQLILYYSCGGGTDTLNQVVNINQPCISVSSSSITCANLGSATVAANGGIGPFSYTWMPTAQTSSVATGLSPGTYTLTVFDFGNNFTYTATTVFTSLIPLSGTLNYLNSLTCNGVNTGTASFTNITGGSPNQNYLWTNGIVSYATKSVSTLSAGFWTVSVTDATTGCNVTQTFQITQPFALNLTLSADSPTACAGTSVVLTGTNAGGTPASPGPDYTYNWINGPATHTTIVSQAIAGTYIYSLTSNDSYSCSTTNTIAIDFIPNPVLNVSNVSICPLQTGTLVVSGANSYTWNSLVTGSSFTANPLVTTSYSVVGSALGCTTAATRSIILKPLPNAIASSNGPVCNGTFLQLYGSNAAFYTWEGPLGFTSNAQSPVINPAAPANSGVYNLTITAVNGCTASTSCTTTVNPTPTISAVGSTVCVNQNINLTSNSSPGSTFYWSGPMSYTSGVQNPSIPLPAVSRSGNYTVTATSALGCKNSAVVDVTVTALPVPSFTTNSPQCFGSTLTFNSNATTGAVNYNWFGPNGFNPTGQNPFINNVTVPAGGVYTLVVTTGPCVASVYQQVSIFPLPTLTLSSNSPICETKSLTLSASLSSGVVSVLWTGPLFSSFFTNTGRDSSKLFFSGIYTLQATDNNSCHNSAQINVDILPNPTVTALSTTVCMNYPAELKAQGANSYFWQGPDFFQSNQATALVPSAKYSFVTTYTVVGTALNTCTSIAKATITTRDLPPPALTVSPANKICLNGTITFEGYGGYYYQWRGPGNFLFDGKVMSFKATSQLYAGTYTLAVTDAKGCTAYTTTSVSFDPLPEGALIGTKMSNCIPFKSDFSFASAMSPRLKTEWQVGRDVFAAKSFSYNFTQAGNYYITGKYTDTTTACTKIDTFVVIAHPLPEANFIYSPSKPVENIDHVIFTNASTGEELTKWNWFFNTNDKYTSAHEHTSYMFSDAGIYPVAMVVENTWGCLDTITKAIRVEPDFTVYVPNMFTPNGDEINDTFLAIGRGIKFFNLSVFNRWGDRIFHTNDIAVGWDGFYNGELCKPGVYTWKISVSSMGGESKVLTGHVTLER